MTALTSGSSLMQDIVGGGAGLLLGGQILHQIGNGVGLYGDRPPYTAPPHWWVYAFCVIM